MIEARHVRALREIYGGLGDSKVSWAVTASLSLALHGIPVEVHDIDILTDRDGAYEIERRFASYSARAVALRASERIRSHFGVLSVHGVEVEIMGDLEIYDEAHGWLVTPDLATHTEMLAFEGMAIPVRTLDAEYVAYLRLGRTDKAELVRTWMAASRKAQEPEQKDAGCDNHAAAERV